MMQLTEEQKTIVAGWISEGLTLAQIQSRLGDEIGIRMTYMEARMLVDDLKLLPKESVVEEPKAAAQDGAAAGEAPGASGVPGGAEGDGTELGEAQNGGGQVRVKVDTLTRPGAMVSGSVTFSDGQSAGWYLDGMGRLGMVPPSPGYRPPKDDIPTFQMLLENELSKAGM